MQPTILKPIVLIRTSDEASEILTIEYMIEQFRVRPM